VRDGVGAARWLIAGRRAGLRVAPFSPMNDLAKCLLAVGVCAGGWWYSHHQGAEGRKVDGEAARMLVMVQGEPAKPGNPVILEFWGTYCGPCVASIPHLNELYARFGSRVQFLAISGEDTGAVKGFMTSHKIAYPVAVDPGHDFFRAWSIKSVPTLIFLDSNQKMQWRGHSTEMTDARLASLLGGN
jgi:thiol-disulfide isomerase/thioredoxin